MDQKISGKTIISNNMQTNKLESFIQAAAQPHLLNPMWIQQQIQNQLLNSQQKSSSNLMKNMTSNKLDSHIESAAQLQKQELQWISNLYQQRLKDLMETNEKYNEWMNSKKDENTQTA